MDVFNASVMSSVVLSARQGSPEELGQPRTLDGAGAFSRAQAGASAPFAGPVCLPCHWEEKLWERLLQVYLPSLPLIPISASTVERVAGLCSLQRRGSPGHVFNALHVFLVYSVCRAVITAPDCSN